MDIEFELEENEGITEYCFTDFFSVEEMQKIQDTAAEALGVASIITEPDGTPITKASNFCNFCEEVMRKSENGFKSCKYSDSTLGKPSEKPIIQRCLSGGLIDAGISFIVGGKHVASWLLGQVRDDSVELDDAKNYENALKLGVDPQKYCEEIKKVAYLPRDKFVKIANLISLIVKQLCEIAYKNYLQRTELNYQKELENKLMEERRKLLYISNVDELTGVCSRSCFNRRLKEIESSNTLPVGIIMGDVNNLKLMNDVFGHSFGDKMLQKIAHILKDAAADNYIIGRCGGDEFNIIVPNATEEELEQYCRKVVERCEQNKDMDIGLSISLGYSRKVVETQLLDGVIDRAETEMYKTKEQLKNKQDILTDIENRIYEKGYYDKSVTEENIRLAKGFGEFLGLEQNRIKKLVLFARVADLGLVASTKYEYQYIDDVEHICKWAERSYRIAKLSKATYNIAESVYQRHEWWNGHGFPMHKSKNEIKEIAAIGMIIKYYVQAQAKGMYGYEMTPAQAKKQIQRNIGTRFSPLYAEKFLEYLEQQCK